MLDNQGARGSPRKPMFLLKQRTRITKVHTTWNRRDAAFTGRRKSKCYTPWQTIDCFVESNAEAAWRAFEAAKKHAGLRDVGMFFKGKRHSIQEIKAIADAQRAAMETRLFGSPLSDEERARKRAKEADTTDTRR